MFPRYGRFIPVVFAITLLFTIGDLFFLYKNLQTVKSDADWVDHSYKVKLTLQNTLQLLTDAETGQRGYLLTDDAKFLTPYNRATPNIQGNIQKIKTLTGDSPQQQRLIPELQKQVQVRLHYLKQGLDLHQQEEFDQTQFNEALMKGRDAMGKVRQTINTMATNEDNLLNARQKQTENSYEILYISSIIGGALNVGLVLLAFYLIWTELHRRNQLERNKDEFISMASHELKTPITSLKLFIQVLNKKLQTSKSTEAKEIIKKITNQTEKLTSLVTDLLDITRIQTGKLKIEKSSVDLNELVTETVDAVQETTRKHKLVIRGKIIQPIFADRYRIYQVLVNLLTNAIKYSPNGGTITIGLKQQKKDAIVSIADKGIGIERKHQKKIFTRLYQVAEPHGKTYPGLGIGLFVSSEIVRQHDGKIWVKSTRGKGSTFSFNLPIHEIRSK